MSSNRELSGINVIRKWTRDASTNRMDLNVAVEVLLSRGGTDVKELGPAGVREALLKGRILATPLARFYVDGLGQHASA